MKGVINTILICFLLQAVFFNISYGQEKIPLLQLRNDKPFESEELLGTESWEQIPGPFGGIIQSLENSGDTLYAGTIGGGLYKSTNFGDDWLFIGSSLPFIDIEELLFFNGRLFISNRNFGIYYTNDDGLTWIPANNGLKNIQVTSLVELDGIIFCSTYGSGVFASTNNGNSWFEKNFELESKYVNELTVYRGAIYLATNQGILISGNYGDNWGIIKPSGSYMHVVVNGNYVFISSYTQVWMTSNGGIEWNMADNSGLGSGYIYSLFSTGPYIIAGRSNGVFVSTYTGEQWVNVYSSLLTIRVYALLNLNNFLYAGTSKGAFFSQDWGGKWKEINNGLLNERILSLDIDNKNYLYAGLEDNGVIRSTDLGNTWIDMHLGYKKVTNVFKDDIGLWVFSNDTLLFTSNYGITWEYRNYGLEGKKLYCFTQYNNELLIGTDDGIFYSKNSGLSWAVKTIDLRKKRINGIFIDKNNYLYLATSDMLYLSRDNGSTWITSTDGMKSYNITYITGNDSILVAGSTPEVLFNAELYVSHDGARTWISSDFNFTDQYVHDIVVSGNSIFASLRSTGTEESLGILYSSNSGKSWHEFNEGLTVKDIRDLLFVNDEVYAASFGSSLLKRGIPEPLQMPVLLYPANNSRDVYPQTLFDWESYEGVEFYYIEIADNNINFDKHIIADYSSTVSQFQPAEGTLKYNTKYYWRVNFQKNNRTSDWSDIFSFTTESEQITKTNLLLPDNNSGDITVLTNFSWEPVENASEYNIQISESEDFDVNIINENVSPNNFIAPKGKLDFNKKYFWRVRAIVHNVEREWSEVYNFTTLTINLISPQLVHPPDNASDVPLTVFFEWESVANADEYILLISDDNQFTNTIYIDTLSTTIFNILEGILSWETDYFWKVKSKFLEFESDWSSVRKFKTTQEVSVKDNLLLSQVELEMAPNPASNKINLYFSMPFVSILKVYISDIKGQKFSENIFKYENINKKELIALPLEAISSGYYLIVFETNSGIISKSLIIQK